MEETTAKTWYRVEWLGISTALIVCGEPCADALADRNTDFDLEFLHDEETETGEQCAVCGTTYQAGN